MAGYFGTAEQKRLQQRAEEYANFIAATPGACQAGRTLACDDVDKFGWDRIFHILDEDGVCGFRLIDASRTDEMSSEMAKRKYRFDTWDVFLAPRSTALAASGRLAHLPLPSPCLRRASPTGAESEETGLVQSLMASAGLVPFSGTMLTGGFGRSTTPLIGDSTGSVIACAHGYMPHNVHSLYQGYAWGDLVAVAEAQRGMGLGKVINALMIDRVFEGLNATHIYELVSATNVVSRRMVEACGLRLEAKLTCGMATPQERGRFTK